MFKETVAYYSPALLLLVIAVVYWWVRTPPAPALNYPIFGQATDPNSRDALLEGHARCPNSPFIVNSKLQQNMLILPMSLYNEVVSYPEHLISFHEDVRERMCHRYTQVGDPSAELISAIRINLTRNLEWALTELQHEAHYALSAEFDPGLQSSGWARINVHGQVMRIIALLSARVFVGLPASRAEEWLRTSVEFTLDTAMVRKQALRLYPALLRPLLMSRLPALRKLKSHRATAQRTIRTVLERHQPRLLDGKVEPTKENFLSWVIAHMLPERRDVVHLAENQLVLTMVAVHTTSIATSAALMNLATYPRHIDPLRQEIEAVIREDGLLPDDDGHIVFSKRSVAKLHKLDSFIKESQRWSPIRYISSTRRVMRNVTLSNGIQLPKGTNIAFPSYAVHMSAETPTFSAEYNRPTGNPPPTQFEGFRFANLRGVEGQETKHQATTTGVDSLTFGHGNHACPGRFFAMYMIKAVMIEVLRNYDVRLEGDVDGFGGEERRSAEKEKRFGLDRRAGGHNVLEVRRLSV